VGVGRAGRFAVQREHAERERRREEEERRAGRLEKVGHEGIERIHARRSGARAEREMVLRAELVESCAGRLLENAGLEGRCAWRSKMRLEGGRLPGLVESSTGQVGHAGQERKRCTGLVGRSG
jgi:hypothetical protein